MRLCHEAAVIATDLDEEWLAAIVSLRHTPKNERERCKLSIAERRKLEKIQKENNEFHWANSDHWVRVRTRLALRSRNALHYTTQRITSQYNATQTEKSRRENL